MCGEKVAYPTVRAAKAGLSRTRKAVKRSKVKANREMPIRVYRCRCGAWHMTSRRARETEVAQ